MVICRNSCVRDIVSCSCFRKQHGKHVVGLCVLFPETALETRSWFMCCFKKWLDDSGNISGNSKLFQETSVESNIAISCFLKQLKKLIVVSGNKCWIWGCFRKRSSCFRKQPLIPRLFPGNRPWFKSCFTGPLTDMSRGFGALVFSKKTWGELEVCFRCVSFCVFLNKKFRFVMDLTSQTLPPLHKKHSRSLWLTNNV